MITAASTAGAVQQGTETGVSLAPPDEQPWWFNPWLVTIVGGIVVIVVGLLVALVLWIRAAVRDGRGRRTVEPRGSWATLGRNMGDTGLEPVTSALSRPNRAGRQG